MRHGGAREPRAMLDELLACSREDEADEADEAPSGGARNSMSIAADIAAEERAVQELVPLTIAPKVAA